jgi:hypothetical protein
MEGLFTLLIEDEEGFVDVHTTGWVEKGFRLGWTGRRGWLLSDKKYYE